MQGAYGGLIIVLAYAAGSMVTENLFLLLDETPFLLLDGENLTLL